MWKTPVDLWASLTVRGPNAKGKPTVSSRVFNASAGGEAPSDEEPFRADGFHRQHGVPELVSDEPLLPEASSPKQSPSKTLVILEKAVQPLERAGAIADKMTSGMSTEEFRAQVAARNSQLQAQETTTHILKRKKETQSLSPPPTDGNRSSSVSIRPASKNGLKPIPLTPNASVDSSEPIVRVNEICQKHAIQLPTYEFGEDEAKLFSAKLLLTLPASLVPYAQRAAAALDEDAEGPLANVEQQGSAVLVIEREGFSNKKSGKQNLCHIALPILTQALEDRKRFQHDSKRQELSGDISPQASPHDINLPTDDENYNGILLEFLNATSNPQPVYKEFLLGGHFSCTVTINPKLPITIPITLLPLRDGKNQQQKLTFGSENVGYSTKKAARKAAAKEAVDFLRKNSLMNPAGSPPMRKKEHILSSTQQSSLLSPRNNQIFPQRQQTPPTPVTSPGHRAAVLCAKLKLGSLEYDIREQDGKPAHYDGAAYLRDADVPHLRGPLGQVEGVFGKKPAKEGIANLVVAVLEKELARRESQSAHH